MSSILAPCSVYFWRVLELVWFSFRAEVIPSVIVVLLTGYMLHKLYLKLTNTYGLRGSHSVVPAKYYRPRWKSYGVPYPDGWYKLFDSSEVTAETIMPVTALGINLVVWRSSDGDISVQDANCPHMGANLAHGRVKKDCIECPFHKWQFDGKSGCPTHIPYIEDSSKLPKSARLRTYPSMEYCNMIIFWFHSNPDQEPLYTPPPIDVDIGRHDRGHKFRYVGRWESRDVQMHLQEFSENTADVQHFACLHQDLTIPWTNIPIPGMTIHHHPQWLPHQTVGEEHLLTFKDHAILKFRGKELKGADGFADVLMIGPGGLIRFIITLPGLGEVLIFHTHLPLEPMLQRVQFTYYATERVPAFLASYVTGNWVSQWSQDIKVWENKIFAKKPHLVAGDGPIIPVRRWFGQFCTGKDMDDVSLDW